MFSRLATPLQAASEIYAGKVGRWLKLMELLQATPSDDGRSISLNGLTQLEKDPVER